MAIIAFWSQDKKKTNQTTSMVLSAVQMAIEKNFKILIIDSNFNTKDLSKTIEDNTKSERLKKKLNLGKVDISSGVEGLIQAVSTNRIAPEVVKNFTKPIFNKRLDFLNSLQTDERREYERVLPYYLDILAVADKYYDLVYIDLEKSLDMEITKKILQKSDIIVCCFEQNIEDINKFAKIWGTHELFPKNKTIPLLTREDKFSRYNSDNVARYIGQRIGRGICSIVYNTMVMEKAQEGGLPDFLIQLKLAGSSHRNQYLIDTINDLNYLTIDMLQKDRFL